MRLNLVCLTWDQNIYKHIVPKNEEEVPTHGSNSYFQTMRQFLLSKSFSDVIFEVEGQEIPAHKTVLSIRCNYFQKMFHSISLFKHFWFHIV